MFNLMKTAILMAAITALFMAIGSVLGGQTGMLIALVVAVGMNFFSYWFSDKLVLKMYNAREVDAASAPQFYGMVRELHKNNIEAAPDTLDLIGADVPLPPAKRLGKFMLAKVRGSLEFAPHANSLMQPLGTLACGDLVQLRNEIFG